MFLTDQIAGWSDSAYSNPEFDELYMQQSQTVDEAQRKEIVWQMQEILWEETPYITLVYATNLEAHSNAVGGVGPLAGGDGGVIYNADNVDTYTNVRPVTAETTTEEESSNTGLIIAIVVIAAVVIAVLAFVLTRKRREVED